MPVSIYAATIPTFLQILECQTSLIHKAAAHVKVNGIPRDKVLRARRWPRDHSFRTHVRLGTKAAIGAVTVLTKKKPRLPSPPFDNFEALARFVSAAKTYLRDVREDQFHDAESETFRLKAPGGEPVDGTAAELIFSYTFPIFYYHMVAAHAALNHVGVAIERWEFYNPPG